MFGYSLCVDKQLVLLYQRIANTKSVTIHFRTRFGSARTSRTVYFNAHASIDLFREKMATTAKQAKTEEKNGADTADEQAGKSPYVLKSMK